MKTTTERVHLNIRNTDTVVSAVKTTMQQIDTFVKHNEYQLSKEVDINDTDLKEAIGNLSLRKKKVLRRYMYKISVHPTIRTINLFLHFLTKKVLKKDFTIKVSKSIKELEIQKKRAAYVEALKLMKLAQEEYVACKGDFYKNRIKNNQAI